MNKRWVWIARQSGQNDNAISILACFEAIISVCTFLFFIAFYDWAAGLLLGAFITPIFFLRSPESERITRKYFEEAVSRSHRFVLYGSLAALLFYRLDFPFWVSAFLVIPMTGIGHLFNSWYVQLTSSFAYLEKGLREMPENYFKTLFCTDVTSRPEMFPGSEGISAIPHWEKTIFFFPRPRNVLTFILCATMTLPLLGVVLLRFVAKASALTCLPLIYLSWPSYLLASRTEQLIWVKSQSAKSIELLRFMLAVTVVASFFLSVLDASMLLGSYRITHADNPVRMLATLYYVTDLSDVRPWQCISVVSAVLSVLIYFLMDGCRREAIAGRDEFSRRMGFIVLAQRVRTMLQVLWLFVAMYFTVEFYYFECKIEGQIALVLSYLWGFPTCANL